VTDGQTHDDGKDRASIALRRLKNTTEYALATGLLALGFLEMILNTDGCLVLSRFFRSVPLPPGLLPDGKQVSCTRSRQFLCTFISQSLHTTKISYQYFVSEKC